MLNIFKPKREVSYTYSLELLKQHLKQLKETEVKIYELHDKENGLKLLEFASVRNKYLNILHEEFKLLSEDVDVLNHVETDDSALKLIVHHLKKIELLLSKQVEEFEKSKILLDRNASFKVLNGENKNDPTKSQFTMQIEKLENKINEMPQIIAKLVVEEENEIEQISTDTRPKEIRDRFEIREDTIYDRETKLEWKKDWIKAGKMTWHSAMRRYGNGMPTRKNFKTLNLNGRRLNYPNLDDLRDIGFIIDGLEFWTSDRAPTSGVVWRVVFDVGREENFPIELENYPVYVRRH